MLISMIRRYAIAIHLATQGALVHASSFRGSSAKLGNDQRALQEDPCAGLKNRFCYGSCTWNAGNCVPVPAPSPTPDPTPGPTSNPTLEPTPGPTSSPSPKPTSSPSVLQTYCGCPECTSLVWDSFACNSDMTECYTCGERISFKQSNEGGAMPEPEACAFVSNEFPTICGQCNSNTCIPGDPTWTPTKNPTVEPTPGPTSAPSPEPTPEPTSAPTEPLPTLGPTSAPTLEPTLDPTPDPTPEPTVETPSPTKNPTPAPSDPPVQTYCGCPQCTETIWNTNACDGSGCYTCGGRISYKQSSEGGSLSLSGACAFVSEEFPSGPCGPVCHPDLCNTDEPTPAPTNEPTAPEPTKSPSDVTPSPTPSPTKQSFCGCPSCTTEVWNHVACNGNECYPCGSRINYLMSTGQSEQDACTNVSNEFPNYECGPACNPDLCIPQYLDEPDENKLIWQDEFEVDGPPDSNKWDYDYGDGCAQGICGWGNNEEQVYTNDASNVFVSDGILRISAIKTPSGYTSTRMVTRGKKDFRYGRIRFRASLANCQARGTWPALWMLPEEWVYGGWPRSGEIDVMEAVGYETDKFHGSVHTDDYNHGIGTQKTGSVSKSKADWHIFEIEWNVDNILFAIDQQVYYQFNPGDVTDVGKWPFNHDFHILMNIAVGGTWGGLQGIDEPAFEGPGQVMEVDWVRAYSI
mmetsp:Transcript_10574/g.22759  ORF Transcript_10574/g.22759 Transcript_10574/m.22759 type:complete len:688 (+) Transcript_10574:124-2187(+)|eukprot:CAMPEP_0183706846 /NCGR_PEP_ID=MMETSP0737-20130205/3567_1 /TAXON_ID=385413 /ORGANISM="Thalassiosira miniscula, Strain CCMP1093" /LENGTH=687 /DNA_ID=CAMNT_0025934367 /DNA_START=75 /DNA_END=2138 /DNA_ORIENTATION=+